MTPSTSHCVVLLSAWVAAAGSAGETRQSFEVDPGWDASNNRPSGKPLTVKQDFGYSPSPGRIGGTISPAGEPAFYAAKITSFSLRDRLSASGVMTVKPGPGNDLLGFFNASTINEWGTPNSLVWRINDRGEVFHVHFEYATSMESHPPRGWQDHGRTGRTLFPRRLPGASAPRLLWGSTLSAVS